MKNLAWANFVLGIWLIAAPFVLLYRGIQAALSEETEQAPAANWIVGALGLWAVVSPYVLHFSAVTNALLNNVIVGAVVAIVAIWLTTEFGRHRLHSIRSSIGKATAPRRLES